MSGSFGPERCRGAATQISAVPEAYLLPADGMNRASDVDCACQSAGSEVLRHADAGQKPGGKAEALALQTLAGFHPYGAELMTRNASNCCCSSLEDLLREGCEIAVEEIDAFVE